MTKNAQNRRVKNISDVVAALNANPPRVRSALEGLRWMFETSTNTPPAILGACARLLNTDDATTPEILHAVRDVSTEWDTYGDAERALFHKCVYTSETRRAVAVTQVSDITAMLHAAPPRVAHALDALRWLDATTQGDHRELFAVCATLLKNPSATDPKIVEAIQTGYRLWANLHDVQRALLMSCVYASKVRAKVANGRRAARQRQQDTESGEIRRCRFCDGNLNHMPGADFCGSQCAAGAAATERPVPSDYKPTHIPAEQRAAGTIVVGPVEAEYDENYRELETFLPTVARVRKDDQIADIYENERPADHDKDDRPEHDEKIGYDLSDEDYERLALRELAENGLCSACNLEMTPTEQRSRHDDRCEICREVNRPPLIPEWTHELIAA
jgi:hypothetical protein